MSKLSTYQFCDLYEMSSGISSKPEQAGHGSPFLSFSAVFNNYFLPQVLNDLMDTSEKEQKIYSIKEGDVFLTRTSEVIDELGMSSVSLKDYPQATYSGFLKRLRPKQKNVTYAKYMAFYLRSKLFRKTMTNNAVLTLRASLNEQIFSYLQLVLPEYSEQVKFGDLLYLISQKIEVNNRINAELEAMAKTLYDYWFVQFDFPDENGKPYKSSGGKMVYSKELKREIPAGWEVSSVQKILSSVSKTKSVLSKDFQISGNIPVIDQSTDFICGYTNQVETLICGLNSPCIVFGDHTRILKFVNFDFARGADGTQILISNDLRMPSHLFYQALSKVDLSNYGYARHFKFLKLSLILLPTKKHASDYDLFAKSLYLKIKQNFFENQKLIKLRGWLLPMLMNGQVRVEHLDVAEL